MRTTTRRGVRATAGAALAAVLAAAGATPLLGDGEIRLRIDGGRVTLIATGARLADVVAEWSRAGDTRFVGTEVLAGEPVTLHLVDAPEADAIRLLLRAAAGYVAAPRRAGNPGRSLYDRVTVLAVRSTPAPAADRTTPPAGSDPAANTADREVAAPALVPMEELQRLLDAAAAGTANPPPEPEAPGVPVLATPFPGLEALRDLSAAADRNER